MCKYIPVEENKRSNEPVCMYKQMCVHIYAHKVIRVLNVHFQFIEKR